MDGLTRGYLPRYTFRALGKARLLSERQRFALGLVERPHYAFGLMQAAREAAGLGFKRFTAIEFGVAGGNGLLALEEYAGYVERETGVGIRLVGFDTGRGLPPTNDYRDAPFMWAQGDFAMDEAELRSRLHRSELQLGLVNETVGPFLDSLPADEPIGFVSFDLDLWSSTVAALDVFRGRLDACLPRVWCYFDDIVAMIDDIGELLAIREFNAESNERKLGQPYRLRSNIPFQPLWADQMFQAHFFTHPLYSVMLATPEQRALPLQT